MDGHFLVTPFVEVVRKPDATLWISNRKHSKRSWPVGLAG
jgi:hypothetical protein